jgi:hypothetical protein
MTDTLELIELNLNLDEAIPCNIGDCGNEAHYRSICKSCRADAGGRICDMHYEQWRSISLVDSVVALFGAPIMIFECLLCGFNGSLGEVIQVIPL